MKVAELRSVLTHIQHVYIAGGAKGPAKDLQVIADFLRPYGDAHLSNFVSDLGARLNHRTERPKRGGRSTRSSKTASLDETAIIPHVTRLREAGTQQDLFEEAFEQLKADSSLSLADLGEIARRYSNSVTKYRSLGAAHKDISQAFIRRARFENKLQ